MDPARREVVYGIPQFSGAGYENWKFRVEKFLKSVGLLEVLSQDVPPTAPEAAKFNEKDGKASNWIIAFIHDDLLDLVREKETAKEIWTTLANVYAKKSVASQTLIRKQLAKLKMIEGSSVKDHLKIFDELIRQLKSAGAKLEEGDLVSQLFVTLPESFDPLVTALENLEEDNLTLDVVRERLLAEELKKNDRMTDVGEEVPAALVGSKQRGHMTRSCKTKKSSDEPVTFCGGEPVVFLTDSVARNNCEQVISFKMDSGATDHLVKSKNYFKTLEKLQRPVKISVAKNDQSIIAWHKGSIEGVNRHGVKMVIHDVLYVPILRENLLAVKKMAAAGVEVTFKRSSAEMKFQGKMVAVCPLQGSFYELELAIRQHPNSFSPGRKQRITVDGMEPEGESTADTNPYLGISSKRSILP